MAKPLKSWSPVLNPFNIAPPVMSWINIVVLLIGVAPVILKSPLRVSPVKWTNLESEIILL